MSGTKTAVVLIVLVAVAILFLSAAKPSPGSGRASGQAGAPSLDYRVVRIDGCQYVETDDGLMQNRVYSLTHKGDCDNPLHRKELQ